MEFDFEEYFAHIFGLLGKSKDQGWLQKWLLGQNANASLLQDQPTVGQAHAHQ